MDNQHLSAAFKAQFGYDPEQLYFSPGRINLIGEHTDYNGGHVFPCAISLGTYGALAFRSDRQVRLYSANFQETGIISWSLDDLSYKDRDRWTNYPKGMLTIFKHHGHLLNQGFDLFVEGNLPASAGLSSSASIELLMATILNDKLETKLDGVTLAQYGQEVENKFIGVNSGIMDQFAVAMGQPNTAIFLDTTTLNYQLLPLDLGHYKIVIMNTNKHRNLAESKYNERRAECEQACHRLQAIWPIKTLGELTLAQFDQSTYLLNDDTLIRRARHAVSENERTLQAVNALKQQDLVTFGRLMNASHISLEYDYEVTGKELNTLAHTAWQQPGILGARMTGAGFSGCAIALVKEDDIPAFIDHVKARYREEMDYDADCYVAEIGAGPRRLV